MVNKQLNDFYSYNLKLNDTINHEHNLSRFQSLHANNLVELLLLIKIKAITLQLILKFDWSVKNIT